MTRFDKAVLTHVVAAIVVAALAFALSGCSPQSLIGAAYVYSQARAYQNPHCPSGPHAMGGLCDTTRMTPAERRDYDKREAATMKGMGR